MAIRDYILSQLRARQALGESEYNRRQLALQQEQARLRREGQQQQALLSGLGQLTDIAEKGIGMGLGYMEKAAAQEQQSRLAEALARAELEGLQPYEEMVAEPAVAPEPPVAQAVQQAEVPEDADWDLETIPLEQRLGLTPEQRFALGIKPAEVKQSKLSAAEMLGKAQPEEVQPPPKTELARRVLDSQQASIPMTRAPTPAPQMLEKTPSGYIKRPEEMVFAEEDLEMPEGDFEPTPAVAEVAAKMDRVLQPSKLAPAAEAPAEPTPEVEKVSADLDKALKQITPPAEAPAPPAAEAPVEASPLADVGVQGLPNTQELTAKIAKVEAPQVSPEEKKVETALQKAEQKSGFSIRRFQSSPESIAKRIVDEVYAKKPQGNPILQFFSGDPQKAAREKLIAQAAVQKQIKTARKELIQEDFDMWMKQEGAKAATERVKAAQLAAEAAMARAEKSIRLKTNLTGSEREKIRSFWEAQNQLEDTVSYGKAVLEKGQGLPIGQLRAALRAYIDENAGVEGSIAKGAGGNLGAAGFGAGLNNSIARSKQVDADLLQKAMRQMDRSQMTPEQKLFANNLNVVIQSVGKALEGGKLTDADFLKYLENLVSQDDPQVALQNINDLARRNYEYHQALYNNMLGTYDPGVLQGYEPFEPTYFSVEEIAAAYEAGLPFAQKFREGMPPLGEPGVSTLVEKAAAAVTGKPKGRKPGTEVPGSSSKLSGF